MPPGSNQAREQDGDGPQAKIVAVAAVGLLISPLSAFSEASFQGLGDIPGEGFASFAHGVSANGSVVAGLSYSASGIEAFRWTSGGGMVGLGDLYGGVFESAANDVSADGSVVVGSSRSSLGNEAFRWTSGGGMVGLGDLAGGDFHSIAFATSADGSVDLYFPEKFSSRVVASAVCVSEAAVRPNLNGLAPSSLPSLSPSLSAERAYSY